MSLEIKLLRMDFAAIEEIYAGYVETFDEN